MGLREMKAKIKNSWSKFTGKADCEEASRLLKELEERAAAASAEFEAFAEEASKSIADSICQINEYRISAGKNFDHFVELSRMFAEWEIEGVDLIEEYCQKVSSKIHVRSKEDLFLIDFDKHKVKTTFQAIFTLGFFTRKKAKETLNRVHEQSKVLDASIEKMKAEKKRMTLSQKSLSQIVLYMDDMFSFYEEILGELDFAVSSLRALYFKGNIHYFEEQKLDCYYLPKRHLLCLMATEQATRIIHQIVSKQYLTDECAIVPADKKAAKILNLEAVELREKLHAA